MGNKYFWIFVGLLGIYLQACETEITPSASTINPSVLPSRATLQEETVVPPLTQLPEYWPTSGWQTTALYAEDGTALFQDLTAQIEDNLPFTNSVLIINGGYLVYEGYFNQTAPSDLQLQHSVAKSFTSALVGIALERGDIPSLDTTVGGIFPEYFENNQASASDEITLKDALMMRSGLEFDAINLIGDMNDPAAYDDFLQTRLQDDLIGLVLKTSQQYPPGTAWRYSTADTELVSGMFQRLVGQSLEDYAVQHLFGPLNIQNHIWEQDRMGVTVGGALLWLTPRDMAKFGYLYLRDGRWDGQQVVPNDWIKSSTQPQLEAINTDTSTTEPITWYGYQWWLWEPGSFGLPSGGYQALGYGGQFILVLPDLDTIIVVTCNPLVSPDVSNDQQRAVIAFIDQQIIPVLYGGK